MSALTYPVLLALAFAGGSGANKGTVNTLGTVSGGLLSSPSNSPYASLNDGFPALDMANPSSGGVAPAGGDFNAILNYITAFQAWVNAGQMFNWNTALMTAIGGTYPVGTVLMLTSGAAAVICTTANSTDPDTLTAAQLTANSNGWTYAFPFSAMQKVNLPLYSDASPTLGDLWLNSTQQTLSAQEGATTGNSVTLFKPGVLATAKTFYTVTCTTAGTYTYDLMASSNYLNTLTLPANFWTIGKTVKIEMWLQFTSGSSSSQFGIYAFFGSASLQNLTSVALTGSTVYNGKVEIVATCYAIGAAGTAKVSTSMSLNLVSSAGAAFLAAGSSQNTTQFQTTAAAALDVQGGFSVNASTVVSIQNAVVTILA